MKNIIIVLLSGLLFHSCSTINYYYSKIATNSPHVEKNYDGDFITENDTITIVHSFFGEDEPINNGILNKTDKELYVDWSRSSLVIENAQSPTAEKAEEPKRSPNIKVSQKELPATYSQIIYPSQPLKAHETEQKPDKNTRLEIPERLTHIPPRTQIDRTEYKLANFPFNKIKRSEYKNATFQAHHGRVEVRKKDYTATNSPLRIKSIITIYNGNPHTENATSTTFEQSFYVTSIMRTGSEVHPTQVYDYITQQGDFFYVKHYKENKFGMVMGVIAISAAAIALEVALPSDEYY